MTDETQTDAKPRYEWQSNGGCERCDALDGHLCVEPPPRPHPNCDCRIIDRERRSYRCDESDVRYEVNHSANIHHGSDPDPDEEFDLVFDYEIICWGNTERISGEVTVSRTYGELEAGDQGEEFIEDALVEAIDKVHEIAASECPTCPKPPLVS